MLSWCIESHNWQSILEEYQHELLVIAGRNKPMNQYFK
jgi:hypothetical protein